MEIGELQDETKGEDDCGPHDMYPLKVQANDGSERWFDSYILDKEKKLVENKKQIMVYVDRKNSNLHYIDPKSAK